MQYTQNCPCPVDVLERFCRHLWILISVGRVDAVAPGIPLEFAINHSGQSMYATISANFTQSSQTRLN